MGLASCSYLIVFQSTSSFFSQGRLANSLLLPAAPDLFRRKHLRMNTGCLLRRVIENDVATGEGQPLFAVGWLTPSVQIGNRGWGLMVVF